MPDRNNDITLRFATRDDARSIHRMVTALAGITGQESRLQSTADAFARYGPGGDERFNAIIAEQARQDVGLSLFFTTYSTWLGEPGLYLQDLYVDDALRGKGLGARLLAATAAHGRGLGATHLRLSVDADNVAAQRFYTRSGMNRRSEEMTYHIGGDAFARLAGDAQ